MSPEEIIDLNQAAAAICNGGIILYPTDTVWGLGCDAANPDAVKKLFELKRRPDSKAMLLLCADIEMTRKYVDEISQTAIDLLKKAERPTTIIYNGARNVAKQLIASDGSIGIRIPNQEFCVELCRRVGGPIVSTSANFAGEKGASCFAEINQDIRASVDYVCTSGRENLFATPSDILKINPDGSIHEIRVANKPLK